MSLTPQDKKFLLTLKDKGYSSDEAFKALQVAKTRKQVAVAAAKPKKTEFQERVSKLTEDVDTSNLKSLGGLATAAGKVASNANKYELDPEKMGVGDYVKEAALAPVNVAAGAAKGVLGGMTKGVEGALDVVGAEGLAGKISAQREKYLTPTGIVQKAGAFIPEVSRDVTTGVLKSGGDLIAGAGELAMRGAGALGMDSASRGANKVAEFREETFAPTNTAQKVGKIGGDIASYVIPGAAVANVGKLAKGASTLQKLGGIGKAMAAEGAVSGGVTALKEGELNSKVAMDALVGAGFPLAASAIGKTAKYFLTPRATKDLIKESNRIGELVQTARSAKIPEADISYISKLPPQNKGAAVEIFEAATSGLKGDDAPTPFVVAGKYLNDYVKKAEALLKEKGQVLGAAKETLKGQTINPRPVKQGVQNLMKNLGIKFDAKGVPNYELSDVKYLGSAKNVLEDIYNITKKNKLDAMDMERLTTQIDQITGQLKESGIKKGDPAINALVDAKSFINQTLGDLNKTFGEANRDYAIFNDLVSNLKHGSTVKLANGKRRFSGATALRRFLGNAGDKQDEALIALDELSKQYGLTPDLDFKRLAKTASIAERVTGFVNPTSLAGVTGAAEGWGGVARKVPGVSGAFNTIDAIKDGISLLKGVKNAAARSEILMQIVNNVPPEVMDAKVMEALNKIPSDQIGKFAAIAASILAGSQLQGVKESIAEEPSLKTSNK